MYMCMFVHMYVRIYLYMCMYVRYVHICMYVTYIHIYVGVYFCRGLAPADVADEESEGDSHLGIVPHQV